MSNVVQQAMYIKADVKNNNNKFWEIKLMDDCEVLVRNGRVGSSGQNQKPKCFDDMEDAEKFYNKKIKEKESPRKGYTKAEVLLDDVSEVKVTAPTGSLESIAVKQIGGGCTETAKLIKILSKKNIHNIVSSTNIKYDSSHGSFRTPLGIITQNGIDTARDLLVEMVPYIEDENYENEEFIDKFQTYLQLIPHKVKRKLDPRDIFGEDDSVQKEGQILDALDASLQDVLGATPVSPNNKKKAKQKKIFDVKVSVLDDSKEFKRIRDYYHRTKKSMHTSHGLDVKKIYTVNIKQMCDAFENKGKPIGNIMELWHGSRVENCLSILKSGLIIPKSSSSHVTGRMFGDGLYASDISTKALNYAQGYWSGKRDNNCFMFLVDFAMGKPYIAKGSYENFPVRGYDSTFAKEGQSGVINNEMIVYNIHQCNIKYLVEFDK